MKNNQTKAFDMKKQIGIRAQQGYADGGVVMAAPSIGGFIKDRAEALGRAIVPNLFKAGDQIQAAPSNLAQAGIRAGVSPSVASPMPIQAPAPTPATPATAPPTPFKFANGGGIRAGRMDATQGGHIRGPGTGTSDSIPAQLSNGEYVLPKDTVDAIGKGKLDQVKNATHTPVNNGIRGAHFDNGGSVLGGAQQVANAAPNTRQTFDDGDLTNIVEGSFGDTRLPVKGTPAGDAAMAGAPAPKPVVATVPQSFVAPATDATVQPSIRTYGNTGNNTFTSTGDFGKGTLSLTGKSNAPVGSDDPYSHTQQYQQGLQLAQNQKDQLDGLRANATQTDAQRAGSMGSGVMEANSVGASAYQDGGAGLYSGIRGGGQSWRDKDRALATAKLQQDAALTARGQDVTSNDNMRTVNAARDNNVMTNQVSLQNARSLRDLEGRKFQVGQQNWQADHQLAADKFDHEQNVTGGKELADKVNSTVGIDPATGKPDASQAAALTTAIQTHLGQRQAMLEAHLKLNPNDPTAQSELDGLKKHGPATIDDGTFSNLHRGVQLADIANKNSTNALNPFGGRAVISDAPVTSLRKTSQGLFGLGGEYTTNRGDTIPARAIEKDGSFIGGIRNHNFDNLVKP